MSLEKLFVLPCRRRMRRHVGNDGHRRVLNAKLAQECCQPNTQSHHIF